LNGIPLSELALLIDGQAEGDEVLITGVNSVDSAQCGDIVFVDRPELLPSGEQSSAAALIVSPLAKTSVKPIIVTEDPRLAFSKVLEFFAPERRTQPGVHPTAVVGKNVTMGEGVSVGAHAFVGDNAILERDVAIHPLAYVGYEATVGENTEIHPHVYIGDRVSLGSNCIVHAGAVIGSDGFGYLQTATGHRKIPQIGTVIIGDDVEIGANTTVDRATVSATVIGSGTKLDDAVHIAHNCIIGRNCLFAGQVALAGSTEIGDNVVMGGQVGVNDHVKICSNTMIGAQAAVMGDIQKPGVYSGYPARDHRSQLRLLAMQHKLPELLERIKELEGRLAELDGRS
jgi:UDP-3-O-[3-hydroxymyristoyl] glucosamine N-acyltransferase